MAAAIRKRVDLKDLDTSVSGKLSFQTVELATYKRYDLRLTAVGAGSVYSSWSTPSAVTGRLAMILVWSAWVQQDGCRISPTNTRDCSGAYHATHPSPSSRPFSPRCS